MSVDLASLRSRLSLLKVDALVLRSVDAHGSEYTSAPFKYLKAVTGFGGSTGTVVATKTRVALFCDPRYWEEAANTVRREVEVVREGDLDAMTPAKWMLINLEDGARVGVDARQYTPGAFEELASKVPRCSFVALDSNPVDAVWNDRPALPPVACWIHPESIAGESVRSKLDKLRQEMKEKDCTAMVISALDEQMWMFNLRGGDILESPVAYAFSIITLQDAVIYVYGGYDRVSDQVSVFIFLLISFGV
jgi:Xaa-Pro aminopeptidase